MHLKENIIEHFDFEAVQQEVWRYLYSWYSADWCIMRNLRKDPLNSAIYLDLYPELNNSFVNDDSNTFDDEEDSDDTCQELTSGLTLSKRE